MAASAEWERGLAAYTSRACDDRPADDPGIDLMRQLADAARLGELALACPDLLGRLIALLGIEATEQLAYRYLQDRTPLRWTADEGAQFISWLTETEPALLDSADAATPLRQRHHNGKPAPPGRTLRPPQRAPDTSRVPGTRCRLRSVAK